MKSRIEDVIKKIRRTMTRKEIPLDIESYDNEDTWNSACAFCIKETLFAICDER